MTQISCRARNFLANCMLMLVAVPGVVTAETQIPQGAIVASIKPLHSLVQAVVGDTGNATLLLDKAQSPHGYQLKPSQIRTLRHAKLVFLVDDRMESFLRRPLSAAAMEQVKVELLDTDGLELIRKRSGNQWGEHDPGEHDDGDLHEHGHDEGIATKLDMHIWLDPLNAKTLIKRITGELVRVFPEHTEMFSENAIKLDKQLAELHNELKHKLESVSTVPFVVFHDAYGYLERRYNLNGVGAVVVNPSVPSSVSQLQEIRHTIQSSGARCVFSEPQFSSKTVATAIDGSNAKSATIDPLGVTLEPGADLYFKLLLNLADTIHQCLLENDSI